MRRRQVLAGAATAAAAMASGFPAPVLAQGVRELKMVTDWPAGVPSLQDTAVRLGKSIEVSSGGRLRIEVFGAGALVRPFETFDAVGAGVADMFHSSGTYFVNKSGTSAFFSAVPFGFTADELFAWVHYGGGQRPRFV